MKALFPSPIVLLTTLFAWVATAQQPRLEISFQTNATLRLSWPGTASDFLLETTDFLSQSNVWRPSFQSPALINQQLSSLLNPTNAGSFFRLRSFNPPDPQIVAPPLPQTEVTDLGSATDFLYTGTNPIQIGVAPGTIVPTRAAVLRGTVKQRSGSPLAGVTVTILNHPEFGQTRTRADGMFDLAANGGGTLCLVYEKPGYCPVHRDVNVPVQDYVDVPDAVMVQMDPARNSVSLGSNAPVQVARGTVQTDADGARRATLIFPPGTCASLVMPGGSTQPCGSLAVRLTEFTVGTNGPAAMPAILPPASGYTYCVELSADEAVAAGATTVQFDRPLCFYLENFLQFPVGMKVPTGYYDRTRGAWIPSEDGRVIKVLSEAGDMAVIDSNGDGAADGAATLANLGITDAERQQVAALYNPDQTLWRVCVSHFTPWDCNWGVEPFEPLDAKAPTEPDPLTDDDPDEDCETVGSLIRVQKQSLSEILNIVGTPFRLHYASDIVGGRTAANNVRISLSGANSLPTSLKRIDLHLTTAGRRFSQSFTPAQNRTTVFTWDGKDAYQRLVQGAASASIQLNYVYDAVYQTPAEGRRGFSLYGLGRPVEILSARDEFALFQKFEVALGTWRVEGLGLGGWTISVQHSYDPVSRKLYLGNGTRRTRADKARIITTVAGGGGGSVIDGRLATDVALAAPIGVAVGPDGSIYFSDFRSPGFHFLRRVRHDGIITTIAGTSTPGFSGDGGPAKQAQISGPRGLAVSDDGSVYFADVGNNRIRCIAPDGIIRTVAGSGSAGGFAGDGGPATAALLNSPLDVAVAPDGTFHIADSLNARVRRVGTDGIITTIAGTGVSGFNGDGIPAATAQLLGPRSVALGPDGAVYVSDANRIRRIGVDGIIRTVAGTGGNDTDAGALIENGVSATEALIDAQGMAVGSDGTLYFGDNGNGVVRVVTSSGIITTLAGVGGGAFNFNGDNQPATSARLANPYDVAISADGKVFIADWITQRRVRQITSPFPAFGANELVIASEDGSQVYVFDAGGRHLRSLHALTGENLYEFRYDSAGQLAEIKDGDGNITLIERNTAGDPQAIVSPYGQRTSLTLDANGYLASVVDPASETNRFAYTADGLMTNRVDPNGQIYSYSYDAEGRLTRAGDPAGGFKTLTRTESATSYSVTLSNALGRVSVHQVNRLSTGAERESNIFPDGTQNQLVVGTDGSYVTRLPGGTTNSETFGPDARWGMQAPLSAILSISTPSGLTWTGTESNSVSLMNPADIFSLQSLTAISTVNGRRSTNLYTAATRTFTNTSAAGRRLVMTIDAQGRVVREETAGLLPITYSYNTRGQLQQMVHGTGSEARTNRFQHSTAGFLTNVVDPLARMSGFVFDPGGRVTDHIFPDGRVASFGYDRKGNVVSIAPPGRPPHLFSYTPVDLLAAYIPPPLGASSNRTVYTYNAVRDLIRLTRADGQTFDLDYESGGCSCGRLRSIVFAAGTKNYFYDEQTGNLTNITVPGGIALGQSFDGHLLTNTTWMGPVTGSVQITYNNFFDVAALAVNGSNAINYLYDSDRLLIQAGNLNVSNSLLNGFLQTISMGSHTQSWQYNGFGEVTNTTAIYSGGPVFSVSYTRDAIGRIIAATEMIGGISTAHSYGYDLEGRLVEVRKNGMLVSSNSFDANGNCVSHQTMSGLDAGVYDVRDRLLQFGVAVFAYTTNDALLTKTVSGQTTTYRYDGLGHLARVDLPGGTRIDYVVDGRGRRIGKKVNGVLVQGFLYEPSLRVIAELDGANNVVSRFVFGSREHVPDYMIKNGITYRIVCDHLGSPRLVLNISDGAVIQRVDYDEWGRVLLDTNPGFQPFGFAGGIYDTHTALVRFGARDYDPIMGRWTTPDPSGLAATRLNLYSYARNDPVNYRDENGLDLTPADDQRLNAALDGLRQAALGNKTFNEVKNQLIDAIKAAKKNKEEREKFCKLLKKIEEINQNPNLSDPEKAAQLAIELLGNLDSIPGASGVPLLKDYLKAIGQGAAATLKAGTEIFKSGRYSLTTDLINDTQAGNVQGSKRTK